jgi:hypothetical protein
MLTPAPLEICTHQHLIVCFSSTHTYDDKLDEQSMFEFDAESRQLVIDEIFPSINTWRVLYTCIFFLLCLECKVYPPAIIYLPRVINIRVCLLLVCVFRRIRYITSVEQVSKRILTSHRLFCVDSYATK